MAEVTKKYKDKRLLSGQPFSLLLTLLLCSKAMTLRGQMADSLRAYFRGKPSVTAYYDSRNTFVEARRAYVWAVKAGVTFGGKVQFGLGYNQHQGQRYRPIALAEGDTVVGELRFKYGGLYTRYTYFESRWWKLIVIPVQIGWGKIWNVYERQSFELETARENLWAYEPGCSLQFKLTPWAGLGADLGYRVMFISENRFRQRLTSPMYAFYFTINWTEVFYTLFPNKRLPYGL
jgi:hypothetical protein